MANVVSYNRNFTFNAEAGEAISEGDLVGLSTAGKWYKADGNATHGAAATNRAQGVALRTVSAGQQLAVAPDAWIRGLTGLTAGAPQYLGVTAGAMTETQSTTNTETVQLVGFALSATEAFIRVSTPFRYQTAGNSVVNFI